MQCYGNYYHDGRIVISRREYIGADIHQSGHSHNHHTSKFLRVIPQFQSSQSSFYSWSCWIVCVLSGWFKSTFLAPNSWANENVPVCTQSIWRPWGFVLPDSSQRLVSLITSLLLMLVETSAQVRVQANPGLCTVQLALAFLALSPCHMLQSGLSQGPSIKTGFPEASHGLPLVCSTCQEECKQNLIPNTR